MEEDSLYLEKRVNMSNYQFKMIELLSIIHNEDQSYLRIKLFVEQAVELRWEIDKVTAKNIGKLIGSCRECKYRLSFNYSFNSIGKQFISTLTKVYRDQSEQMTFVCTEKYINSLKAIKNIQMIDEWGEVPTLSSHSTNHYSESSEDDLPISKLYRLGIWTTVLIATILMTFFLGSDHSYVKKVAFAQKLQVKKENDIKVISLKKEDNHLAPLKLLEPLHTSRKLASHKEYKLNKMINYSIQNGDVALTFDDGPSRHTKQLVDILNKYKVGGTFFFVGVNVKRYPSAIKYVNDNGFSIGNHSMTHTDFIKISYQKQKDELTETNQLIENLIHKPVVLFRPPYGANNKLTKDLMVNKHTKMVLWDRDPKDWKTRNASKIYQYVRDNKESGAIILLHESQAVVEALPEIIDYLKDQKLNIVDLTS